ncbi:hypothetical protein ACO1O0_001154 [Amphichorda felina]
MRCGHGQRPRCEDRTFILSWLDDIRAGIRDLDEAHDQADDMDHQGSSWRPYNLPMPSKGVDVTGSARQERLRWAARDSPLASQPSCSAASDGKSTGTFSDVEDDHDHAYEKRPRRKTRQDRYDTKRQKVQYGGKQKKRKEKKNIPRHSKRLDNRKGQLRSGKEVMDNFTSAAITADKVTVSPIE